MLKVWKTIEQSSLTWILFLFSSLYLALAFPFSFFRHDDWLMIGNVARIVPNHWKFIFEPYLVFNSVPEVWFFRPWFKLILYLLYHAFGFHYYGWLLVNLLFTLGTLILGYLTLKDISKDRFNGLIFVLFFVFSLHFHFASLVWVGEGTMNCPQIFLLFLNFFLFNKALSIAQGKSFYFFYILGILVFALSLGFKEAAIFHLPFLLLILFKNPNASGFSFQRKTLYLVPYFVLACTYLYLRLVFVPFNPGYIPRGDLSWFLTPILFLSASLLLPLISLFFASIKANNKILPAVGSVLKLTSYLTFFIPFFITYMGHGFFSPGWLLAPGFYWAFILGLFFPPTLRNSKTVLTSLAICFVVSTALVFYQTHRLSWWSWYRPQRQILEIIRNVAKPETETINVFNCETQETGTPHLHRVVGYSDAIQEVFWLNHKKLPKVNVLPCSEMANSVGKQELLTLSLKWSFPEFTVLVN